MSNAKANGTSVNSTNASNTSVSVSSMRASKPSRADHAGRHVVALGLAIVSFAASERAAAQCAPESPVNNATVTCTGATRNQNRPDGYGTATDTGNTINVLSGASVTGDRFGLIFDSGTVKNSGTISGGFGASAIVANRATIDNFGTISAGTLGTGISASVATVTNFRSGTISAEDGGIGIEVSNATVDNFGRILADGTGILAGTATVTNFRSGTISGGTGILAFGPSTIVNAGAIIGLDGTAIELRANADTLTLLPG